MPEEKIEPYKGLLLELEILRATWFKELRNVLDHSVVNGKDVNHMYADLDMLIEKHKKRES